MFFLFSFIAGVFLLCWNFLSRLCHIVSKPAASVWVKHKVSPCCRTDHRVRSWIFLFWKVCTPGPKVIKLFSCSTLLTQSMARDLKFERIYKTWMITTKVLNCAFIFGIYKVCPKSLWTALKITLPFVGMVWKYAKSLIILYFLSSHTYIKIYDGKYSDKADTKYWLIKCFSISVTFSMWYYSRCYVLLG